MGYCYRSCCWRAHRDTLRVIQNLFLAKRQREQLEHDAAQRRLEREMALRREVYLEVAGATANLQEYLLNLGNPNISSETQATIVQGSSAALNRAQLVGALETLEPLNKAQEFFGISSIDLNLKRGAVELASLKISNLERESEFIFNNRMELAKTVLSQKDADIKKLVEALMSSLEARENEIKERLDHARSEHREELKKLVIASVHAGLRYNNLLVEPLIMARRELNFEIDEDAYRKMTEVIILTSRKKLRIQSVRSKKCLTSCSRRRPNKNWCGAESRVNVAFPQMSRHTIRC